MRIVDQVMDVPITTTYGSFLAGACRVLDESTATLADHMLVYLNLASQPCNLRLNSACYTGGIFGDIGCDCAWQLAFALTYLQRHGQGLVIYHLQHEGRGNGLLGKLRSFAAARDGRPGVHAYQSLGLPADAREFGSAVLILTSMGIRSVNLISNNPDKQRVLEEGGIRVARQIPAVCPEPHLREYYAWKRDDFGHRV
jgi:GTP cyclohydrolase II